MGEKTMEMSGESEGEEGVSWWWSGVNMHTQRKENEADKGPGPRRTTTCPSSMGIAFVSMHQTHAALRNAPHASPYALLTAAGLWPC